MKKEKAEVDRHKYLPKTFPEDLELASLGKRVLAYVIDLFIITVIFIILFIVTFVPIGDMIALIPVAIYVFAVPIGYFVLLEANGGRTFGKKLVRIRTVNHKGKDPEPDQIRKSSIAKGFIIWNIIDFVGLMHTRKTRMQRTSQHSQKFGLFVVKVPEEEVDYESEKFSDYNDYPEYDDDEEPHEEPPEKPPEESGEEASADDEGAEEAGSEETVAGSDSEKPEEKAPEESPDEKAE